MHGPRRPGRETCHPQVSDRCRGRDRTSQYPEVPVTAVAPKQSPPGLKPPSWRQSSASGLMPHLHAKRSPQGPQHERRHWKNNEQGGKQNNRPRGVQERPEHSNLYSQQGGCFIHQEQMLCVEKLEKNETSRDYKHDKLIETTEDRLGNPPKN